jgi:hypothetical protein
MSQPSPLIDGCTPRELFAAWVEEARAETQPPPTELAGAYLVDLLSERLRARGGRAAEPTLAEAWLTARGAEGALRVERLRAVGDRALFVAGFFGESLTRKVVGIDYYRDIGQAAYGDLSCWLARQATPSGDGGWGGLFGELADRFADCIELLATVSDRARVDGVGDVLHLYERWLATGSEQVRRRLARLGCVVGPGERRRLQ